MSSRCCVRDCDKAATIRQPLGLGSVLTLHVPLCGPHNRLWEEFNEHLKRVAAAKAQDAKQAWWAWDAALALALYPPDRP